MIRKYELTNESIIVNDNILYRIRALRFFGDVRFDDLGGYVESEDNLSHEGTCWIYNSANVYGAALVSEDSEVFGQAQVYGNASVCGSASVYDSARVYDNAIVCGDTRVYGNAHVFGAAHISGDTRILDNTQVRGDACISGDAYIWGKIKLDSGIWNKIVKINNNWYVLSTTLEKILMGRLNEEKI